MSEEEQTNVAEGTTGDTTEEPVAEKPASEEPPKEEEEPPKEKEEPPKEEEEPPKEEEPPTQEPPQETRTEEEQPKEEEPKEEEPKAEEQPKEEEPPKEDEQPQEAEETPPEEPKEPERPPRTKYFSLQPDDPVELLIGKTGIAAVEPTTIGAFFKDSVKRFPNNPALAYKGADGEWNWISYTQYYDLCVRVAKSFLKLELEPFHSVAILGFNSTEWFISGLGAIMAGGVNVGIYTTNKPDVCRYIIEDSRVDIVVVEDDKQLQKILSVREQLPNVKAIVQYRGTLTGDYPNVYEWDKFMELGSSIDNQVIEDKIAQLNPGHCASIIYTSGTTGYPKGVMLSHDSITWMCKTLLKRYGFMKEGMERVVSYLPLSHIAAQFLDMYMMMYIGGTSYFAQPDALKGSLRKTLVETKPTIFVGVPRVWEKFMEAIKNMAPPPGSFKSKISNWAKGIGLEGNTNIQNNGSVPWGWTVAGMLVFKKVKEGLGLSETKMFITTAAPTRREVLDFFMSLNIPLLEIYGMSEGCGAVSANVIERNSWKSGTSGKALEGIEVMLQEPNDKGEGELCYRGRNVMMGYYKNEEKTKETIDPDGWLHSGDLAIKDKDGFIVITGRKKELIITSGGENVAPVPVEDAIKSEIPFVSNAMLIGDQRNFLTCLLTLKVDVDPETAEPTDNLTADAARLIAAKGSTATKVSQIIDNQDTAVFRAIQEGIDRANAKAISNAATVKKWTLLASDFSESGGELGPTQKVRRFHIVKKYAETIEGLYAPQ